MGSRMSLLFAEHGLSVHFYDPSSANVLSLQQQARDAKLESKLTHHRDYESLCRSLRSPKVFLFSTPHGSVADKTIDSLEPFLAKGDLIMDAGNERWTETERRQARLEKEGIHYIGMGVSGGYQSARRGPSISPGGSKAALDLAFPFLEIVAAKDKDGTPCVAKLGPRGCGHYVKMIHNGIEHGMMTALAEVWALMAQGMGLTFAAIADIFDSWNRKGPLADNFLLRIGADICRTKDPHTGRYVLENIRDKVVQDVDGSEGTGVWSCEEAIRLHESAPTMVMAHLFRLASADAAKREGLNRVYGGEVKPGKLSVDKTGFLKDLKAATYASMLASFVQGLHVLAKADAENGWNLNYVDVLQLWRAGCIIRSNRLTDMLRGVYTSPDVQPTNLLAHPAIAADLSKTYLPLKTVVLKGIEADMNLPTLAATLEYYKYSTYTDMPTSFQEAQMDYFGEHMFDLKSEEAGKPVTGKHHFEWKPAKGIHEQD